jgi:chemotaxis signal transduction protein
VQYLPFRVAGRDFVVDASRVQAIVPFQGASHHHAIPVIDLRKRLGLPALVYGRRPFLVVIETKFAGDMAGFVADYVSDLIEASPKDCRRGKLHTKGRPRWLLDPDSLSISGSSSLSLQTLALTPVSRPE